MKDSASELARAIAGSVRDLAPILAVVLFFQLAVLRQPLPNLVETGVGILLVLLGLTFFLKGLEQGLFPLGESLATAFARKGSLFWLLAFAFALGFGTTVAEPALIAVAAEAAAAAAGSGVIEHTPEAMAGYALGLRLTVGLSVGIAIVIGVFRILKGWRIDVMLIIGYSMVVAMTLLAPREIIGIAYDSGGVTTSTITVPLVTALGVGLASSLKGRNPMLDGFGLIAFASLAPIIFVMAFGMLV
ncbi:MAG: DUF1538 domain-containing protein [bacterium]|nr:DUF1538 domain-containing protein [bacterium]